MIFLVMVALNIFLLANQFKTVHIWQVAGNMPKVKNGEWIIAGQLLLASVALFLEIMSIHNAALVVAVIPVVIAGVATSVVIPVLSEIMSYRFTGSIFLNRGRKIIFE